MVATIIEMPSCVFKFCGQSHLDTFELDLVAVDFDRYDDMAINSLRLSLEAIRKQADTFSFWQRRGRTGRPPTEERTLLIAFLLQQLMDLTFRETEGMLAMVRDYYHLDDVPDHSTLCRKLSSKRWAVVLERFFAHVLEPLPRREAVVATDATGYSGRKRSWRETKHVRRAVEDWVKVHATVEVDEFIVLSYSLTRSNVHDSQMFADVWDRLPSNIVPIRSLADSAYVGNDCLAVAREHGATPMHSIKKNAKYVAKPVTFYHKLVHFAHHFPQRFAALKAKRAHAETVFSMISETLGHRLRCRSKKGRKNEVRCKLALFNLLQLAARREFWA